MHQKAYTLLTPGGTTKADSLQTGARMLRDPAQACDRMQAAIGTALRA